MRGGGDTRLGGPGLAVKRRLLVRVLAVAHFLGQQELMVIGMREQRAAAVRAQAAEIVGDGAVVSRGVREGFGGETKPGGIAHAALALFHLL